MAIEGIIFDCDGTLVDSEGLASQLISQLLAEQGLGMSSNEVLLHFRGVQFQRFVDGLGTRFPRLDAQALITDFRSRSLPLFERSLKPIFGAIEFVETLKIPACVASNGPRAKIETCLKSVGLFSNFQDMIVSAYEVKAWKPDPRIMLHAANILGLSVEDCLVVEDSLPGVEAGLLAGCQVAGFGDTRFTQFRKHANFHPCPDYLSLQRLIEDLGAHPL